MYVQIDTQQIESRVDYIKFFSTYGPLNGQEEVGLTLRFLALDQKLPELGIMRHISSCKKVNYCPQQACRCFKTISVTPLLLCITGTAVENSINHHQHHLNHIFVFV